MKQTKDLDKTIHDLLKTGGMLQFSLAHYNESVAKQLPNLPHVPVDYFFSNYETWYSRALQIIRQVLPSRVDDFIALYKNDNRKTLNADTYTVSDALKMIENQFGGVLYSCSPTNALSALRQQNSILKACLSAINPFSLLRDKKILFILDGDTELGAAINASAPKTSIKNSMPYLSGPKICELSNKFGLSVSYSRSDGTQSRCDYLDDLLVFCIENDTISELLMFLFSKNQFSEALNGLRPDEIEYAYTKIVDAAIEHINGILSFDGHKLIKLKNKFMIQEIEEIPSISTPAITTIDRHYISDLSERAMEDVEKKEFDSALTKSRTLLEEVFCYVIEKKGEIPSDKGDIGKLYLQVKSLYNMHQVKGADVRINMLLSGLEKILNAITEMRNEASDSHGVGARRFSIEEHHARLFVNSATTMADFILAVGERKL